MNLNERKIIEELFAKLRQVEQQGGQRDKQAEDLIQTYIQQQPSVPYYMAQILLIQEQALLEAQKRIEELEAVPQKQSSFLGGLFGLSKHREHPFRDKSRGSVPSTPITPSSSPVSSNNIGTSQSPSARTRSGGGFLAGAMQTALGVTGGMLFANMLTNIFHSSSAPTQLSADTTPSDDFSQIEGYDDHDSFTNDINFDDGFEI